MLCKLLPIVFSLLAPLGAPLYGQDTRTITEPIFPPVCTALPAQMAIVNNGPASETTPDTIRVQAALTACGAGNAVELAASGSNFAFLSAPLNFPSGVSLIVDGGVTLFASRNREDYQVGTISSSIDECGTDGTNGNGCKNFLIFNNNSTNANSGLYGYGVIDGRGYANGFTAWGVKIQSPWTSHNTDGIDPVGSNVTITNTSISNGDDQIAVGASSASANITISNVNMYSGHGMSIGSYTQGGLSNMVVSNINMAGQPGDSNEDGIRI